MARENLWLVKCTDRDHDDVDDLREEHMAGHLAHIEAIVDHIAKAGPLKDAAGEKIVGSMLVYRTDDLEQAKAWLDGDPTPAAVFGARSSGPVWCWRPVHWPVE